MFLQAPFPENDHCVQPSAPNFAQYLKDGPLFDDLGLRLDPHPHPIDTPPGAELTNAFRCSTASMCPVGMVPNLTAAVTATIASVRPAKVLHPDGLGWQPVPISASGVVDTPVVNGCALLRIE